MVFKGESPQGAREYDRFQNAKRSRVLVRLGECGRGARIECDSRWGRNSFGRNGLRVQMDAGDGLRNHSVTESEGKRAEGDALVHAVAQRWRFIWTMLSERDVMLYMHEAMQHRSVLREKQRRGKQQWAKKFTHVDSQLYGKCTPAVKRRSLRALYPIAHVLRPALRTAAVMGCRLPGNDKKTPNPIVSRPS